MKKSIIITGSSGYIGSYFVKHFAQKGYDVYGIDLVAPPAGIKKYIKRHEVADISDQAKISAMLQDTQCKNVIHCAAKAIVSESVKNPELYYLYNVEKAETFLHTCITSGVENFIFSSTAATYGTPQSIPIKEDHPNNPINPYGESKLQFENILLQMHREKKIKAGIFRYFNACGADQEAEIGEDHHPETHLIPNIIQAMLANRSFSVYGDQYETRDGTCVRDYIHIIDLAAAHYLFLEKMQQQDIPPVMNLGTTSGYSILEIVQTAEKMFPHKLDYTIKPPRPGDPGSLVADATLATEILNWSPQCSDLKSILQTAYNWHKKQKSI